VVPQQIVPLKAWVVQAQPDKVLLVVTAELMAGAAAGVAALVHLGEMLLLIPLVMVVRVYRRLLQVLLFSMVAAVEVLRIIVTQQVQAVRAAGVPVRRITQAVAPAAQQTQVAVAGAEVTPRRQAVAVVRAL
jgi:hypothetical protein